MDIETPSVLLAIECNKIIKFNHLINCYKWPHEAHKGYVHRCIDNDTD